VKRQEIPNSEVGICYELAFTHYSLIRDLELLSNLPAPILLYHLEAEAMNRITLDISDRLM
jgi:hypothetical protein